MYLLRKCLDCHTIRTYKRLYSLSRKNHYDVLKLRKNCSDKEIKDAFIKMSKEYHPDKNKDVKAQDKFVQIVEAYNVLGKPSSRAHYDNMTELSASHASYVYRTHVDPYYYRNNSNYGYYYDKANKSDTTAKETTSANEKYYGFAGLKKLPNYYIICICFGIAFIGVALQVYVIRNMYTSQRRRAQERSKYLAEELERIRTTATSNGNELQTRLLLDKIVTAANPTVTKASLGQALANEKKDNADTLLSEFGIGEATEEWYSPKDDVKVNLNDVIRKLMSYMS